MQFIIQFQVGLTETHSELTGCLDAAREIYGQSVVAFDRNGEEVTATDDMQPDTVAYVWPTLELSDKPEKAVARIIR